MGSDMWEYQIPALVEEGLRCIVYDIRGCHRSDHTGRGYDFDTLADDLAALIAHLDLNGLTLAGYSMGGGILARYLARHGGPRIAKAVLIAANTPFLLQSADNPEGLPPEAVYNQFLAGLQADRQQLLTATAPHFFGTSSPVSAELMQWAVNLCFRSSAPGMLALYKAVNHTDFRPDMAAFTMPTLILHGDADPFQPIEATGRRAARAIAGSRLEVYGGAAHGLFVTHKERLNTDLTAFVKS